ncbi:DUF3597 domain-containing protein [Ferribacterium limneticum]|nr:DUF3597 domain-containing protein [Ferribacterium limneticum]UCV34372.1 DUF3597 domain-containing protein [Ferribacterium limneticum]
MVKILSCKFTKPVVECHYHEAALGHSLPVAYLFNQPHRRNRMGIFSNILAKLGFGDEKKEVVAEAAPAAVEAPVAAAPVAISAVDVVAKLESLASAHAENLNWKVSIVDLLKLLGLDSSLAVRKELAAELGCPADKMGDSAQMNMWLHKTVLQKLAENGGNIPAELL